MTDLEFDIIDELYFVEPFAKLLEVLSISESELKDALFQLLQKGWIKCYASQADEVLSDLQHFDREFKNYRYLATKAGLLEHNSR